jgi:hypothetical protein
MDSQDLRNLQEAYLEVYNEGKVAWHDPKNPNPSGYTPKEKSEAKRKQLGVDNPDAASFEKGGPGEKEYARHGNLAAAQEKMSKRGKQPKGKSHQFKKNPFWKKTEGQVKRTMFGTNVPKDKKGSYPSYPAESYDSVYEATGLLGTVDKVARNTAGTVGGVIGREKASKAPGANLPIIGGMIKNEGERRGRQQGQQMYDKAKETVGGLLKQDYEFDNFDVILEYLVSEGYADTNENALVIMANMSEEWMQTILEAEVLAQKGGVPGSVKVRPSISIPGTNIGVGPNKPVPGTFTTTTPGQREKIKQGDTHIDRGVGGMQPRQGAGPTSSERQRYNRQAVQTGARPMAQ